MLHVAYLYSISFGLFLPVYKRESKADSAYTRMVFFVESLILVYGAGRAWVCSGLILAVRSRLRPPNTPAQGGKRLPSSCV